jgi:hypothetical protein
VILLLKNFHCELIDKTDVQPLRSQIAYLRPKNDIEIVLKIK